MNKKTEISLEIECNALPFAGYEGNKVKPPAEISTSFLIEMIENNVIGESEGWIYYQNREPSLKGSVTDIFSASHIHPGFVRNALIHFLPVLSHSGWADEWLKRELYQTWRLALKIFEEHSSQTSDDWLLKAIAELIASPEAFFPGNKQNIAFQLFGLIQGFYDYDWDDLDSRAVNDYKMIHQLIYLLSTKSLFLPTIEQAKDFDPKTGMNLSGKVFFDKPNYASLSQMNDFYHSEKKKLEEWIENRLSHSGYHILYSISDGYLVQRPVINDLPRTGFVDRILTNLLRLVLESFTQKNSCYLSNGQLYIGVCLYCGKLLVRATKKQIFCKDKCRREYHKRS